MKIINSGLDRFPEYYSLFVSAGYDLQTITRMTPEDFTAVGQYNIFYLKTSIIFFFFCHPGTRRIPVLICPDIRLHVKILSKM
jgi:hypothetical protein